MKKRLIWLFVGIGIFLAIRIGPVTNKYEKIQVRNQLREDLKNLNSSCPRQIGTIGQMDSVSLNGDTLGYYYTINGSPKVNDFYSTHYDDVKDALYHLFTILNGQKEGGKRFTKLLTDCNLIAKIHFRTPSGKTFSWQYSGQEIENFINNSNLSPEQSLLKFLSFQIELANSQLPSVWGTQPSNLQSLAMESVAAPLDTLEEIRLRGKDVIFFITTPENEVTVPWFKCQIQDETDTEAMLRFLCEDPNFREFIISFAIAKVNLKLNYYGTKSKDVAEIEFPYLLLRKYAPTWGYSLEK